MSSLVIREIRDDDYDAIAAGLSANGRLRTPEEVRANSRGWEQRRRGKEYVVVDSGAIVGTAGVSPSCHMPDAFSIGGQFFDGSRSVELYQALLSKVQKLGGSVVTCTIAAGDRDEKTIWEQLGAEFKDAGRDRLYPVVQLPL